MGAGDSLAAVRASLRRAFPLLTLLGLAHCGPSGVDVHASSPPGRSTAAVWSAKPPSPIPALPVEAAPLGRLPADVRPLHYALDLTIVPERERVPGSVAITLNLDRARDVIWLHGRDLNVLRASVEPEGAAPVAATWHVADARAGVAALRLARPVGPGKVTARIAFEAPFARGMDGLYRVERGGASYAFTQLEPMHAREAFPSLDEPAFKAPFDVTLTVPKGAQAVANTRATGSSDAPSGLQRVTFATTEPLPTYLLAWAVGPLDTVEASPIPPNAVRKRPLPLRGVAARGRGPELAFALARTSEIIAHLEEYFGVEYPYDKLDIIAVPERQGAMENAGAITFSEWLILLDERSAPVNQRMDCLSVLTHELAHLWLGDLVTMPWWDDLWLKEAAATWMAARTTQALYPAYELNIDELREVHAAMAEDSLLSARQIRQEIREQHDIFNAFDGITYQKGGGVIAMFERWLGPDTFRQGVRSYLKDHRHGSATVDDLLASLSAAAGRDVAAPFRSFLFQPGVPFVEASLTCGVGGKPASLALRQSRFLPVGSAGSAEDASRTWQIPICARYPKNARGTETAVACALLTEREGTLPLPGEACPAWVLPNADGAGYYRWSLPSADVGKLSAIGASKLNVRERLSLAESLNAAFRRGTTPAAEVMTAIAPLARDPHPAVAVTPMSFVHTAREWLEDGASRAAVEQFGRSLYAPLYRELGWEPRKGKAEESPGTKLLRQQIIVFLTLSARDAGVRKEAAARGKAYVGFGKDGAIHPEAVDPNLAGIALAVAVQEEGPPLFDALAGRLSSIDDERVRAQILHALGAVRDPALAARARALSLDPRVRLNEMMTPIQAQLDQIETREAAWEWFKGHVDAVLDRLPSTSSGYLPLVAMPFCDKRRAAEVESLFSSRIQRLDGGPRNLASTMEVIKLCTAQRDAQLPSLRAFFARPRPGSRG